MAKEKVRIRKAPKYLPFMLLFAGVGFISALVLFASIDDSAKTGASIFGMLVGYLSAAGAAVGLIVALIVDWISTKRTKTLTAERSR